MTIVEWLFGPKNAFMLLNKSINQALPVASAEDAKNGEEPDMDLPADRLEAMREYAPPALGN
ncbi:hypothetical protein [Pseudomonas sp. NPDC088444]|uniref:hypothetical protein n=1 Tax=Pseudomonas sp. NPDC088444 TaxID=3364456 RepID=UPI00384A847C